ncbi:hypothetical protein TTHERM_00393070 (macronuclear) [Tetrahymena thermophila SB210]|uniref:Uncharacterized protein n=1 Tax=Tetrahymena thermophila (strain SB210) TaxID=312017 RepID=Q233E2_TETTS|nr:hypothetical protein TTHERM_00393070 [Tetrahymena thermophila SB210]EAR91638.1 hypothetical protein TTHERM_00393070 [Tetrahymena thermophila SB210]|eukprot:XP_001011883.1 hypothetical protein TTHERM_00393070 [Tetrahymena thermophila SB210]
MDFQREDAGGSKVVTPKIMFRRPGSKDGGGILPGLRLGQFNNNFTSKNQDQSSINEDQFPQTTKQNNQIMLRSNLELTKLGSRENIGSKTLIPIRSQNDLLSREVDKEINNMNLQSRIRDLESMLIDFKGNIERRIQKIQDDIPGKFNQNFKRLEDKEGQMWKDNNQKQGMIQDQYQIIRETIRKNNEQNGATMLELQRKIDEVTFQNHKLQKSQEQLQVFIKNGLVPIENNNKKKYDPQEGQLSLLKEQFNQELRIRENAFEDLNRNYQDLQKKVFEQEKEFLVRLQKQRDQIIEETNIHKQQIKQLEGVKMEKLLGENDYLKQLIDQVERRLEDEMDKRLKQEFENKAYLEQKMNLFKDEIRNEEKSIVEGEQRFIKQMHDSIQAIHSIIKFTKEELEANLASTQTLFSENVKNFGHQIEVIKENLETKVMLLERGYKEVNYKVNETKQLFSEHANTVNMQIERQNEVIENNEQVLRRNVQEIEKELKAKLAEAEKESELWKDKFEKKNLAIFQEISNAMKGLKQDMNTEKKENIARIKDIKEEIDSYQNMNQKLITNLKEHTDRIQQSTEFLIQENDRKQNENLLQTQIELEKMMRQLDDIQFDRAKEFANEKVIELEQKFSSTHNQSIQNLRNELGNQVNKLRDDFDIILAEKEQNLLDRIKNNRIYAEELNDQLLRLLKKDQNDLFEFRQQHMDDLRSLRKEHLDNLRNSMKEMSLEMDSKIDVEHKKWEVALLLSTRSLERQLEETNARFNENMDKLREELIEKFKYELEEIVMKKIMEEIQQEKNERIRRENEIETSMHNIKNMILEALHQKVESAKALARALVTEEAAERAKNDEEILRVMKESIDTLDRTLRQLIRTSIEECMYILRQEIQKLEDKLNEFKEWTMKELKKLQDEMKEWQNEIRAENYLRDMYQRLRDEELQEVIKKIEFELISIKKNREEDLLLLIQEIHIRQEEITRVDSVLDDHESRITQQREDHDNLRNEFDEHQNWAKETIKKQRDDFERFKVVTNKNVKYLDETVKFNLEYVEGRMYLDNMYNRVQVQAIIDQSSNNKSKIRKIFSKLKEVIFQINENFQQQENFEEKTEKNFKIAEKAIRAHTQYLNSLDARLHMEEILNKLISQDQQRLNNEIRKELNTNLVNMNEEIQKAMKEMKEDNYKQIDELENRTVDIQNKLDEQGQKLEEQNEEISNVKKLVALVETDLKATEHEMNQRIDEGINNLTENINQQQQENEQFKEEVNNKIEELNQKSDEFNQKIEEINQKEEENNQKYDEFNQKLEEQNQKLDEQNQKLEEQNQKLEEHNEKLEEQNQKVEEHSEKLNEVDQKVNEMDEKLNQVKEEFGQEMNQKLEQETQKVEELQAKQEEMNQQLQEKEQGIEDLAVDIKTQMERIDELEKTVEGLKTNVDDVQEKNKLNESKLNEKNEQKENVNESMQKKFDSIEEEVNNLKQEYENLKEQDIQQLRNQLEEQIQNLEEQIKDMQDKSKNQNNASQQQQEMEEVQNNVKELQQEFDEYKNQMMAVGQALDDFKQINTDFTSIKDRLKILESK